MQGRDGEEKKKCFCFLYSSCSCIDILVPVLLSSFCVFCILFFIGKFQRFFRFLVQACCCSSFPLCLPLIFFKGAVWDGQRMGFAGRMGIIEKKGVGGCDRGREMEE